MSDEQPSKTDVAAALKRLRGISSNKTCFDCGGKNPTWSSVTYGIFLCIDCSAVHRSLGVHLSFVRSTQLDTSWSWLQLRSMQLGGNAHAAEFFRSHGCATTDAQQKYNSRAAQLYREKLQQSCIQAMKIHGTKLYLDTAAGDGLTETGDAKNKKDEHFDFFKVHSDSAIASSVWQQDAENQDVAQKKASDSNGNTKYNDDSIGPSVETNLNDGSASDSGVVGKHTLGARKITAKPQKKGKLGAQKVEANFEDFEKQAEAAEKRKQESLATRAQFDIVSSAEDSSKLSSRLTYQDVEKDRKQEEERIRKADPKKAEQLERLGMGIGARGKISHSIMSDMTKIEQEKPANRNEFRSYGAVDRQPVDEWDRLDEELRNNRRDRDESTGKASFEDYMNRLTVNEKSSSRVSTELEDDDWKKPSSKSSDSFSRNNSKKTDTTTSAASDDAQKKFGNAKAISSDMYFGNNSTESDWETKSNTNRFEGKNSISSAEYFGTSSPQSPTSRGSSYANMSLQAPDLTELKEGVKQGITKVAGRLSSMATNVMSNIQERYG